MSSSLPKTRRRRRSSEKRKYFTQVHEDAIVRFVASTDPKERTELYVRYIQPAFDEMVDKIVFTFKFTTLPNIDELREECKIWLTTILDKFDPEKGSKAFSYFSVITKNWFIHQVKKNSKKRSREIEIESLPSEARLKYMATYNDYDENREQKEFWTSLWAEIDSWDLPNLKPNEKKVLEAIRILLSNSDNIEIFNKKAIYLYMREITGLNTKQIVNNLNKMRIKYRAFKVKWNEEGR
jgi:DNA-directed RNA polymerase specialized sigma24 family protein